MKFLLYSINYAPELTGIGKYNGELASALAQRGIETNVLTAPPYYPEWQRHKGYPNRWSTQQDNDVCVYRCPLYVPSNVTTLKRLLHLASFAVSSGLRLLTLLRLKPDVVFIVQPTLFCAPMALLYCKITGAKAIMHIQDFEIDAMFGLGLAGKKTGEEAGQTSSGGRIKRIIRGFESWLLKRFDRVSSISYSMLDNAREKGVEDSKLLFFPNWADTSFVTPDACGDSIRAEWGYASDDKIVLYSGNIGNKQGLEVVLDAAEMMVGRDDVRFVIIGSGIYSATLRQMAVDRRLTNVEFKPLQPWADVPKILAMADVHLVVQKFGAADAVLPSKLTNILSAGGHALVTAESHTELGKIENKYPGIYTCVEPENSDAFIAGLTHCLTLETKLQNLVARNYALENLNTKKVIDRFSEDIKTMIDG